MAELDTSSSSAADPAASMLVKYPKGTSVLNLDGDDFRVLFRSGSAWLEQHHQAVNALNVFPVPDGDTGTNMLLTMQAALEEIETVQTRGAGAIFQALAHGALMGARGNSGVILSQILRGIAHGLAGEDLVDAAEMITAFRKGAQTAYRGVVRPVEGTILTVIRQVAEAMEAAATVRDLRRLLEIVVRSGAESVERTPTLLAVLAEAGVVDAGGKGLLLILEGMQRCLNGLPVGMLADMGLEHVAHAQAPVGEYGYDVQCVVLGGGLDVEQMRAEITGMGDSVLVVGDSQTVKVHVHTDQPGTPLNYCASLGDIDRVIIENMQLQYERFASEGLAGGGDARPDGDPVPSVPASLLPTPAPQGSIGAVVVAAGEGLERVFRSLGAHAVVQGGQTMNPSTQDILDAIEGLGTDDVIVLPNNKNIILAAQQAAGLSSKRVRVVPSRTLPQGINALLVLNQQADLDANAETMSSALSEVQTGEVTTAVRDVRLGDMTVSEGDYIGLLDDELVARGDSPGAAAQALLEMMHADEAEIITLYRGEPLSMESAEALEAELRARFPDQEIELMDGGQPHYHFIFSVE